MENDFTKLCQLLTDNGVYFNCTYIYDENNVRYNAIWLNKGHIEFDIDNNISNIVTY